MSATLGLTSNYENNPLCGLAKTNPKRTQYRDSPKPCFLPSKMPKRADYWQMIVDKCPKMNKNA